MRYLGEFEQLILFAVVELGDEAYGGAIRDVIEQRTGRVVSSGAIHTTLGRLAGRDLVSSTVSEPAAGRVGRPRKYYAVEPAGARALRDSYTTIQAMAGGLMPTIADLAEKN
jgi:DNA-binding PadR family transcriptional regulator